MIDFDWYICKARPDIPVVTRSGESVRVLCVISEKRFPLYVERIDSEGVAHLEAYLLNGRWNEKNDSPEDLMMELECYEKQKYGKRNG